MAADLIEGRTLHSFLGLHNTSLPADEIVTQVSQNSFARERIA